MLLVFDTGNTSTTAGIYQDKTLLFKWFFPSDKKKSISFYSENIKNKLKEHNIKISQINSAIVSSVVYEMTFILNDALEKELTIPVLTLSSKTHTGIKLKVDEPKTVGADRIANVCAAYAKYKMPAVVIDFGTATTFDVINEKAEFLGGIIAPGIAISARALGEHTSLLPDITISAPEKVIATNTIDNMLCGLVRGHATMIDGLIEDIEAELDTSVLTIATGGYARLVKNYQKRPFNYIEENLTLEGLRLIYERNKEKACFV